VWTSDISKLATFVRGSFLNLYVILDLFSRYVVAWMVAERENSALAKQLFVEQSTVTASSQAGSWFIKIAVRR
jgi:putative transposase